MARYEKQCTAKGSFGYASNFKLYVELTDTEGSPDTNKSKLKYKVYCQSSGSGSINSSHLKYFKLNGQEIINVTESINVKSPNAYINIAEGTKEIEHNSDGTKVINFEARIEGTSYGVSAQLSDSFTLTTIPRASSVGATSAYIEENTIININRASNNFTHTLRYSFCNLNGTIVEKTSNTSINFKLPTSFYAQIPNQKSSWGTIYCDTYNGNIKIGTKSCIFTVNTNEEKCKPTLSATVQDGNSITREITKNADKLIKYKSHAQIYISTSAKNGDTIVSIKVNDFAISDNSLLIQDVETNIFEITITDSRGYSNKVIIKPTMIDYRPLTIRTEIKRIAPTTGKVSIDYNGKYSDYIGDIRNVIEMKLVSIEEGSQTEREEDTSFFENSFHFGEEGMGFSAKATLKNHFDYKKSYTFILTIKDRLTTIVQRFKVSQGMPVFNWGKDFVNIFGDLKISNVNILELIFPIGSTYITQTNVNPSTILGFGTWERLKGKVCLGLDESDTDFSTIRKTGGEKTHKLTIDELPSHYHNMEDSGRLVYWDSGLSEVRRSYFW